MSDLKYQISGMLLLDKPAGMTSQGAVSKVKRLCGASKAGHCGTLDPMATGVLPILLGRATIFSDYFLEKDKRYLAEIKLGVETNTYDLTGDVLRTAPVPELSEEFLSMALAQFRGEILQRPPIYSALKRNGRKLCDVARAGETIELVARPVIIYALECLFHTEDTLTLRIHCGKGTYIRSLAHDLGELMGCGAALAALRREAAGPFDESECVTLETLKQAVKGGAGRILSEEVEEPSATGDTGISPLGRRKIVLSGEERNLRGFTAEESDKVKCSFRDNEEYQTAQPGEIPFLRPIDQCLNRFPALESDSYYLKLVKNGLAVLQRKLGVSLAVGKQARLYEKGQFLGLCESVETEEGTALKLIRHYLV